MKRLKLPVILSLLTCLIIQSAYADELAVWDKLKASNAKGYVLLLRHALS